MSLSSEYGTSSGDSDRILRIVCVKIIQEVWRCEGKNVFLHCDNLKSHNYEIRTNNKGF